MDAARLIPPGLIPPGLIQTGLLTRANPMVDRNRVVHCRHPAGPEDIHSLLIIAEGRLSDPLPDTIHHITSKDLALIRGRTPDPQDGEARLRTVMPNAN